MYIIQEFGYKPNVVYLLFWSRLYNVDWKCSIQIFRLYLFLVICNSNYEQLELDLIHVIFYSGYKAFLLCVCISILRTEAKHSRFWLFQFIPSPFICSSNSWERMHYLRLRIYLIHVICTSVSVQAYIYAQRSSL